MAETLGDLVDAVAGVQQRRRDQMPDPMQADRPDLRRHSKLVEPVGQVVRSGLSGRIVWPQRPANKTATPAPRERPQQVECHRVKYQRTDTSPGLHPVTMDSTVS
ncbi:hypothetical protein GCM10010172_04220 [Paractinoplanes ferrugineus]|uniref:Uncharacterized protein n=1 Tax=Paractinoplanes ferrugineus TaxID=113564 RepID=A0A919J5Q9_9ACTN|nr:hypothetical protein [Actinoplanes ferrugineus]GIE13827.1 hypothetical protein Afe05nite_56670 [Actinoplanes ferrugineus]